MREPVTAFVGIGANLGDPVAAVRGGLERLASLPHTRVTATSSLYRTAPQAATGPDFINAVARIETRLDAMTLLDELQRVEAEAGRERPYPNAPRTLDLDLLLYGAEAIANERLVVPHPRMFDRAFVLVPLAQIAPSLVSKQQLAAVGDQRVEALP